MEQIYTIPINEKFEAARDDHSCGCPVCALYRMLEDSEVDLIMGASMMEPDIRIQTNKLGFSRTHFDMMLAKKNRLSFALTMESHLDELREEISGNFLTNMINPTGKPVERIKKLDSDCYVCERVKRNFARLISNIIYMWEADEEFREKFKAQPYFCLPHYRLLLEEAEKRFNKKKQAEFLKDAEGVVLPYFDSLREDIKFFCKKFDYRFKDEPWGNSKDSPERVVKFLSGDLHTKI